jgi:hypothetical protein
MSATLAVRRGSLTCSAKSCRVSQGPLPAPSSSKNPACEFPRTRLKHSKGRLSDPEVRWVEPIASVSGHATAPRTTVLGVRRRPRK